MLYIASSIKNTETFNKDLSFGLFPEKLPVEAKPPWFKQAIELEEDTAISEEPT